VPTVAAAGLIIPKTSSRAITSPAGTADRMEVLAPVDLNIQEILEVVKKTKGCLVWGGALDLAPADDAFIKIEHPLSIDPLLLPSIMSKKKAMGSKSVVIDIPTGRGAKIKTIGSARNLAEDFVEIGKRLGIHISCAITFGEQPLGYTMGPALEAREVLETLAGKGPEDIINKVSHIIGILFETMSVNRKQGAEHARKIIMSGKANKKFRQIIEAQGGNPKIKPSDIPIGDYHVHIKSNDVGRVLWIKNAEMASLARTAGAPRDKEAGIKMNVKMGDKVKKGTTLFTIYSKHESKLDQALKLVESYKPYIIGKTYTDKMLLDKVPSTEEHKKIFMLER
ncbi:MAG: thymidine phosphorylase, partial [Candidatus Aenigmarchaeota archaeon]|nr:thymidine phosphorylase [Candidatus Aenigmarchaeota archaeon]